MSWGHHVHPDPLQYSAQPQGDPLGCVFMSLWVLSGVRSVRFPGSFVTTYLDDRCVAASSHSLLFDLFKSWVAWSRQVGLLESVSKTVAVGRRAAESRKLKRLFPAEAVGSWIRVLGACSYNGVRGLTEVETARVDSACRVAFLLRAVRFPLSSQLSNARLFALSRANFGWVVRSPTWDVPYCTNRLLIVILKNRICVRIVFLSSTAKTTASCLERQATNGYVSRKRFWWKKGSGRGLPLAGGSDRQVC